MSLFNNLSSDNLEKQGDSLGGFSLFESGLYDGTVKLAYADKYDSGAMFVALTLELGGKEYRETITITNKKGENFYLKDGKKMPLPGFTQINDLVLLITGNDLSQLKTEKQTHKVYDFQKRSEVAKELDCLTDIMGKPITVGIIKRTVNKQEKDGNGVYQPINEKRDENVIDKFFHAESGKTVNEFKEGVASGTFKEAWGKKNTGVTQDRYKEQSDQGKSGGLLSGGAKPAEGVAKKSLFG